MIPATTAKAKVPRTSCSVVKRCFYHIPIPYPVGNSGTSHISWKNSGYLVALVVEEPDDSNRCTQFKILAKKTWSVAAAGCIGSRVDWLECICENSKRQSHDVMMAKNCFSESTMYRIWTFPLNNTCFHLDPSGFLRHRPKKNYWCVTSWTKNGACFPPKKSFKPAPPKGAQHPSNKSNSPAWVQDTHACATQNQ